MKQSFYKLLCLSLAFICSCDNENSSSKPAIGDHQETNIKSSSLLIIAEDRSGSTGNIRKMTVDDYSKIFHSFAEKHSGIVAVRVIGNPKPEDNAFYRLEIKPFSPILPNDEDATLDEKAMITSKNKLISKENEALTLANQKAITDFLESVITPKIIEYRPSNKDISNIEDALEHIQTLIDEPSVHQYSEKELIIISDGMHDANKLKGKLALNNSEIKTYVIGWKDLTIFSAEPTIFESPDAFILNYSK